VRIELQSLGKRVVDRDNIGGDRAGAAADVADLQSLVMEAIELRGELTPRIIDGRCSACWSSTMIRHRQIKPT
jgi:hypothetical protein